MEVNVVGKALFTKSKPGFSRDNSLKHKSQHEI